MKISIPIGESCLFVQIDQEFEQPIIHYLKKKEIIFTPSCFVNPDIIIDSIISALNFVEMLREVQHANTSKHGC